ncbi:WD40 repeat domain-containing serine/threonine protein kinase [Candidatus Uabimicrobium amorphum]|uniref:non-specific serine/threonine protein kinase n=1 Tax=Uabimicrobium amorphum TaxID=2596890 RepID=A0A5S9ISH9_UABAM|nr:WD40 repeat domain-containing serine/threonine protein kinase [Candidatus Uabimicrobium amorphum]BBM86740.1 protein kinase [Candidatus Uabimicrobium amorphum]
MATSNDFLFGKKAVENGFLDEKRLRNCYLIQKQSLQQGKKVSIAEITQKLKFLNDKQIEFIHSQVQQNIAQHIDKDTNNGTSHLPQNSPPKNTENFVQEYLQNDDTNVDFVQEYRQVSDTQNVDFVQEYRQVSDTQNVDFLQEYRQFSETQDENFLPEYRQLSETQEDQFIQELRNTNKDSSHQALLSMSSSHVSGETYGRYVIKKFLGKGGMGKVCLAHDPHLERDVAIKLMKVEGESDIYAKRFLREARAVAKLNHKNIISVYDIGYDKQQFFFIMDYIEGGSLKDWMGKSIPLQQKIRVMAQIITAIQYAHSEGIIHRDLKPANIMLTKTNEPKIMDFGLVKLLQSSSILSRSGAIFGTLQYMPPEQASDSSAVDERSDIYSLGVILYELLTGRLPFTSKTRMKLLTQILNDTPTSLSEINSEIPVQLSHICLKALQKKPHERYQTAQEFAAALQHLNLGRLEVEETNKLHMTKLFTNSTTGDTNRSRLEMGDRFGRYIVETKLGEGGMGAVYRIRDEKLNRSVALKIILGNQKEKQVQRFLQEARATASLKHPNIVEVYEIGELPQNYFTMELIEGRSLASLLRSKNLDARKAAIIMAKCSDALQYAHEKGIIHRDVKPSNIMMERNNEPKVMDFGLAKDMKEDSELSKSGDVLGTVVYMSPEQADGAAIDARSDVYSLGASLYEVLTKRPPFQGESPIRILKQIFTEDPLEPRMLNPDIPKDLEAICLKCLQKKPEKRYQSARELCDDLKNFIRKRPVNAKSITPFVRLQKAIARNKLLTILFVVILLSSVAITVVQTHYANIAMRQKEQAVRAKDAEEIAKNRANSAKESAEKALAIAKLATEKAQIAERKVEESLYRANLLLADKYNDNNQLQEVEDILNSIAQQRGDAQKDWEYRWQKHRKHFEKDHPVSQYTSQIRDLSVSDEGYIAMMTEEPLIKVFNPKTNKFMDFLDPSVNEGWVWVSCAISPDAKYLVAGNYFGNIHIWDVNSQQKVHVQSIQEQKPANFVGKFPQDAQRPFGLKFSNDSKVLLVSRETVDNSENEVLFRSLMLFDMRSFQITKKFSVPQEHRGPFDNNFVFCDLSDDVKYAVATRQDSNVYMYQTSSSKVRVFVMKKLLEEYYTKLRQPTTVKISPLTRCAIHPNNRWIFVCGGRHLYVIDVKQNKIKSDIVLSQQINDCTIDPSGKKIVAGTKDGSLHFWSLRNNDIVYDDFLTGAIEIRRCVFSADGQKIYTGGKKGVKVWGNSVERNPKRVALPYYSLFCAAHPTKDIVVVSPIKRPAVIAYNSKTGKRIVNGKIKELIGHMNGITHGQFDSNNVLYTCGYDGKIQKWDVDNMRPLGSAINAAGHRGLLHFTLIDNEKTLVVVGRKSFISFVDLPSKKQSLYRINDLAQAFGENEEHATNINIHLLRISWDGLHTVAVVGSNSYIYFLDTRQQKIINLIKLEQGKHHATNCILQFDAEKNCHYLYADNYSKIIKYRVEKNALKPLIEYTGNVAKITRFTIANGRLFGCSNEQGNISIWPLTAEENVITPYFSIKTSGYLANFALSKDGSVLFASGAESQNHDSRSSFLQIWDSSAPAKDSH